LLQVFIVVFSQTRTIHGLLRSVFDEAAPQEHHINAQVAYWMDAFGAGRSYHGGEHRLNFHHTYNAPSIMNVKGATRWMHHMTVTLMQLLQEGRFSQYDPRVFGCIVTFLETKMRTYAMQHG